MPHRAAFNLLPVTGDFFLARGAPHGLGVVVVAKGPENDGFHDGDVYGLRGLLQPLRKNEGLRKDPKVFGA